MKTEVQKNIVETFKKLNETLASFSEEELNTVPYKDSWTAGQTAQAHHFGLFRLSRIIWGKNRKNNPKISRVCTAT
ncbi:hypothetical protein ACQ9BO_19600 [Flavobacterium sp. P21]|uniref:hypothetical protein n=1 Tax=Flavobacterium sp. P21 TaxID=3423948 RepID=UPI003D664978